MSWPRMNPPAINHRIRHVTQGPRAEELIEVPHLAQYEGALLVADRLATANFLPPDYGRAAGTGVVVSIDDPTGYA